MKQTSTILLHLFYFLPKSITFRSFESFIETLQDESKSSIYSKYPFFESANSDSLKVFLKEAKQFIKSKSTKDSFNITKEDSLKTEVEKVSNSWSSGYKNLLTKMSKRLMMSSISVSDNSSVKQESESDRIRKVAEFYKKVDVQVSEWLYELAERKE